MMATPAMAASLTWIAVFLIRKRHRLPMRLIDLFPLVLMLYLLVVGIPDALIKWQRLRANMDQIALDQLQRLLWRQSQYRAMACF
jgi:hypothetical protein